MTLSMSMLCFAPIRYLGLLAFGGGFAELHDGGHVDGLDETLEGHGRSVFHARIGGAYGRVETLGGGFKRYAGLLHLLGGGSGWHVGVFGDVARLFGCMIAGELLGL